MSDFETFMMSREWQPIESYDRVKGDVVLFRWPKSAFAFDDTMPVNFTSGYFGVRPDWADGSPLGENEFRHAQDFRMGEPLTVQPTEFALITDCGDISAEKWRARLMMD